HHESRTTKLTCRRDARGGLALEDNSRTAQNVAGQVQRLVRWRSHQRKRVAPVRLGGPSQFSASRSSVTSLSKSGTSRWCRASRSSQSGESRITAKEMPLAFTYLWPEYGLDNWPVSTAPNLRFNTDINSW